MSDRFLGLAMGFGVILGAAGCALAPTAAQVQRANPAPPGYAWAPAGLGLYRMVPQAAGPGALAANQGQDVSADFKRMESYEFGGVGGPPDLVKAAAVLGKIVAAGDTGDVTAERRLAIAYQFGKGLPQSNTVALSWWRAAAENGDLSAESMMIRFYTTGGDGLTPSLARAFLWKNRLQRSVSRITGIRQPGSAVEKEGS